MAAQLEKRYNNAKFKDPSRYTALAVDFLDCKWGGVAKELSKALQPESADGAWQLVQMYVEAFNQIEPAKGFQAKAAKQYGKLFEQHVIDPEFPSYHPLFALLFNELKQKRNKLEQFDVNAHRMNDVRISFGEALADLKQQRSDKYQSALSYLDQLHRDKPTESKVFSHINEVLYEVEHAPLAIDQRMSLLQSYVSPECKKQLSDDKEKQTSSCLLKERVLN